MSTSSLLAGAALAIPLHLALVQVDPLLRLGTRDQNQLDGLIFSVLVRQFLSRRRRRPPPNFRLVLSIAATQSATAASPGQWFDQHWPSDTVRRSIQPTSVVEPDPRSVSQLHDPISVNSFNKLSSSQSRLRDGPESLGHGSSGSTPGDFDLLRTVTPPPVDSISGRTKSSLSSAEATELRRGSRDKMLSGPYDRRRVKVALITPSRVIAVVQSDDPSVPALIYSVERQDSSEEQTTVAPSASMIPLPDARICGLYFLAQSSLHFFLPASVGEDHLTNGIIIFENPSLADDLYALNGWDRRTLRLHTLKLGLRYRQIDVIQPALRSLDRDQQLAGCKMLLEFIRLNMRLILDESFWNELLQMAMQFVAGIIKIAAEGHSNSASASASASAADAAQEMSKFSKVLSSLRTHKSDVKTITKGAAAAAQDPNVALFTSPFSAQKARSRVSRDAMLEFPQVGGRPLAMDLFGASTASRVTGSAASAAAVRMSPLQFDSTLLSSKTPSPDSREGSSSMLADGVDQHAGSSGSSGPTSSAGDSQPRISTNTIPLIDSDKVDEFDEMQAAFVHSRDRWEKMQDFEIVADALVTSNISLAMSFMRWRARVHRGASQNSAAAITWKFFRHTAYQLIYQVAMRSQLNLCRKMIHSIGESTGAHFRLLAWSTADKSVRHALLNAMGSHSVLESDKSVITFSEALEASYPMTVYSAEFSRRSLQGADQQLLGGASSQPQLVEAIPFHEEFQCADLSDFVPPPAMDLRLEATIPASSQSATFFSSNQSNIGFSWYRLNWLARLEALDPELRARILLESRVLRSGKQLSLTADLPLADLLSMISFFSHHADVAHLHETLLLVFKRGKVDSDFLRAVGERIRQLPSAFFEQSVDLLAKWGNFVLPEESQSHEKLLVRLARLNSLLPVSSDTPSFLMRESSDFASFCLQFCVDAKMPALLQCFLDAFDFARSSDAIQHIVSRSMAPDALQVKTDRTWVKLLFLMRNEAHFFDASLLNAKMCLESKRAVSINSILSSMSAKEKRPFMALASLLYAPVSLKEAMDAPKDKPWYVERRQLLDFFGKFPTMREAVFASANSSDEDLLQKQYEADLVTPDTRADIVSAFNDVSLVQLLAENVAFDLGWIFGREQSASLLQPGSGDLKGSNESSELHQHAQTPSFQSPAFEKNRFSDRVDIAFYLTRGEPLRAFQLLASNRSEALKGFLVPTSSEPSGGKMASSKSQRNLFSTPVIDAVGSSPLSSTVSLSLQEMAFISQTVRLVALQQFDDISVVAACVSFLEMCDINSQEVRVDVEAARRLFQSEGAAGMSKASLVQQLLGDALPLRERLQEATSNEIRKLSLSATSPGALSLWRLVAQFCYVHKLPPCTRSLTALAQADDWVSLLQEAEILGVSAEVLLSVISGHMSSVSLRDHLVVAIRLMLKQTGGAQGHFSVPVDAGERFDVMDPLDYVVAEFALLPKDSLPDLFKLVLRASKRIYPGEALLEFCVQYKQPLLAVVAANFPDAPAASCVIVWLHASLPDSFRLDALPPLSSLNTASERLPRVAQAVQSVMEHEELHCYLQRAFQLIDPTSPLLPFVEFQICFAQYRYSDAARHLDSCLGRLDDESLEYKIGDRSFVEQLIVDVCDAAVRHRMPTSFERREYLRLLAESGLNPSFAQIYQRLLLIEHISSIDPLHAPEPLTESSEFEPPSPSFLLNELLNRKMFDTARSFATSNNLGEDLVAEREAAELILEHLNRGTFESHEDRCSVLSQVDELLVDRNTGAEVAGHFFLSRAHRFARLLDTAAASSTTTQLREDLILDSLPECTSAVTVAVNHLFYCDVSDFTASAMTVLDGAKEQIVLLKLARCWLDGSRIVLDVPDLAVLQDIDAQILRSSVLAQAESEAEKHAGTAQGVRLLASASAASNLVSSNLSGGSSQVLDSMIGALLNADNFAEATRISAELNHESLDFVLVAQMLELAKIPYTTDVIALDSLSDQVHKIFSSSKARSATLQAIVPPSKLVSVLSLQDSLCRLSRHARECCDRILVRFKVSRLLSLSFDELLSLNPYELVDSLLLEGPEQLLLLKHFIQATRLSTERVAVLMGERCFKEIAELDPSRSADAVLPNSASANDAPYSPLSTPVKPRTSQSRLGVVTGGNAGGSAVANLPRFWASRHFNDYLDLATSPSVVGDELVRLWQQSLSGQQQVVLSHVSEVELIIRALMSFRRAQEVQKQNRLFAIIKERVALYAKNKNFKLLVRLITGTKQYSNLSYVLDILVKSDCFEMLLSKNIYQSSSTEGASGSEDEDRRELAISLYNFLKSNYPTHTEKMKLLFLRFTMYREYADILQERAWASLNATKTRLDPTCLLQSMDLFLEAATNYAKEKAFVLERKCLDMARLVQLQFELVDARVVNLKPDQALQFATMWPDFQQSNVVICAYNLVASVSDWVDILHHQSAISGNFAFLEEFLANVEVEDVTELFSKIIRKHKAEIVAGNIGSGRIAAAISFNVKRLLDYMEDIHVRFRLAQELGMSDVVEQLMSSIPGIDYFVQTPSTPSSTWMQSNQDEVAFD